MLEVAVTAAMPAALLAVPSAVYLWSRSRSRQERALRLLTLLLARDKSAEPTDGSEVSSDSALH
jgi:hypothetical protein